MNTFRSALDDRLNKGSGPVMPAKKPRGANEDLDSIKVGRAERRTANHREDDRHRLASETAKLKVGRKTVEVELVNLSGGGAMIRTDVALQMFQKVSLVLGDCDGLDCAVLWIKDDRVGLEFVPETQIEASRPMRDKLLLEVLQRNFPDVKQAPRAPIETAKAVPLETVHQRRSDQRHPLIWSGEIHFSHCSSHVRLRNISETGALVDSDESFPPDAEVLLDLRGAGQHFARVCWSRGDQVGLKFTKPFDLSLLAREKPTVADHRWIQPDYLRNGSNGDSAWSQVSIQDVEGFLKR